MSLQQATGWASTRDTHCIVGRRRIAWDGMGWDGTDSRPVLDTLQHTAKGLAQHLVHHHPAKAAAHEVPHCQPLPTYPGATAVVGMGTHPGHKDVLGHLCRSRRKLDDLTRPLHPAACQSRPALGARLQGMHHSPCGLHPPPQLGDDRLQGLPARATQIRSDFHYSLMTQMLPGALAS